MAILPLSPACGMVCYGSYQEVNMFRVWTLIVPFTCWLLWLSPAAAAEHAVILLYHHVADDTPAVTSVNPVEFAEHLDYLDRNGFQILPLSELLEWVATGKALPEKSAAITFDDGYKSVYQNAVPLLKARGWPFAIFINPQAIDRRYGAYMNWDELREVRKMGGELLNHTNSHDHLIRRLAGESTKAWEKRVSSDITKAQQRIEAETGAAPRLLAYPYGEFSPELKSLVVMLGYTGVAQQSGVVSPFSDIAAIPRFPMMGSYAGKKAFSLRVNSRPLPVKVLHGEDNLLKADQRRPLLRAELGSANFKMQALRCFLSSGEAMQIKWVDRKKKIFELMSEADLPAGRSKYTCTAPARDNYRSYYWFSHLWIIPKADGSWPKE